MKHLAKILLLLVALVLVNCKTDDNTKALELAKLEGIQIGYDSAVRLLSQYDSTVRFLGSLDSGLVQQKLFYFPPHPGNPGHVHDGPSKALPGGNLEKGILAITRMNAAGHDHAAVEKYFSFINPNGVDMTYVDDGMSLAKHRHFKYRLFKIPIVDPTTGVSSGDQEVAIILGHNPK